MATFCNELRNDDKLLFTRHIAAILLVILASAALLRLIHLGQSPPGLNQDEAVNAWNAWCLLKTGVDQHGISWPIFYCRGLGGNGSALYLYLLMPFQAIGGLNVITTRLPAAVGGIIAVFLIYYVAARLFDRKIGLVAAALLAFDPWHIQMSRWGHEACICPLFGLLVLATILWANFPFSDNVSGEPKPFRAAFAGAATGVICYGYQAIRIFVPVFLFAVALAAIPAWRRIIKTRRGIISAAAFVVTFTLVFGPMIWQYIFHPEGIAQHNKYILMPWGEAGWPAFLQYAATRYIHHFGPDFLFINGDLRDIQAPPNMGMFYWFMLPLMLAGAAAALFRFRQSVSVRMLLVFILVYPVSDSISPAYGMHALRSSPGLCAFILLSAFGAATVVKLLYEKSNVLTYGLITIFIIIAIFSNVRYLRYFYGGYNRDPLICNLFHVDLLEACGWLRNHYNDYDAVFCTTDNMTMPYIVTLVALNYDPDSYLKEHKVFFHERGEEWDYYARYGKIVFMYPRFGIYDAKELKEKASFKHMLFIVRPGELHLTDPVYRVTDSSGREWLWLCEL